MRVNLGWRSGDRAGRARLSVETRALPARSPDTTKIIHPFSLGRPRMLTRMGSCQTPTEYGFRCKSGVNPNVGSVFPEIFATTLAAMLAYNHKGNRSKGDSGCNTKKSDSP